MQINHNVQCADGILSVPEYLTGPRNQAGIAWRSVGRDGIRKGLPQFATSKTMAEVQAMIDAEADREAQKQAAEAARKQERRDWIAGLSEEALDAEVRRYYDADMAAPDDLLNEQTRRGQLPKPTVATGAFADYVEAERKAEAEGRLEDFEDGVWGSDGAQGDAGAADAAPALPSITERMRANIRRDYDESPMRHMTSYAEWHAGCTATVQAGPHSRKSFWDVVLLIAQEQRDEEVRLLAELRTSRQREHVVLIPVRIIDRDDAAGIHATIYVPGRANMRYVYSVTYNSAPRAETRAAFIERLEDLYQAAQRDPMSFFFGELND